MIRLVDKYDNYILDKDENPLEFFSIKEAVYFLKKYMTNIKDEIDAIKIGIYFETI